MLGVWDVEELSKNIPYRALAEWDEYFSWKIKSMYYADTMSKGDSRVLSDPVEISNFLGGLSGGRSK